MVKNPFFSSHMGIFKCVLSNSRQLLMLNEGIEHIQIPWHPALLKSRNLETIGYPFTMIYHISGRNITMIIMVDLIVYPDLPTRLQCTYRYIIYLVGFPLIVSQYIVAPPDARPQ